MGSARDYFEGVRAAQRLIDGALARLDSMRAREGVRAQRYEATGRGSGSADAMRATDERIDAERRILGEVERYRAEVARGRRVCAGVRAANPGQRWADALELRFIDASSWRGVAQALDVSERQARLDAEAGLDWVDSIGIAAAEQGMGRAQMT